MTLTNKTGAVLAAFGLAVSLTLGAMPAHAQTAFSSDLTIGSTGTQVTALQNFLIQKGYSVPAGATGYFGAQTKAALAAYQAANGIMPSSGYFGPITRAKVNASQGGSTTPTPTPSTGGLKGGEASLERFDAKEGDDDEIAEGETGEVGVFSFNVEDGDIELNRVDLSFTGAIGVGEEKYPWKTFDSITLLVNGKKVATEDVSDKRDWLRDKSPYTFRFSGLKAVVKEGAKAEIAVEVTVADQVKNVGADWTVFVNDDGVRGTDAEGLTQSIGDDAETATFSIAEEGAGEELNVRTSAKDPAATVLKVKDDKRSDWYSLFVFDLEADETDIDLDTLAIDFTTGTANVQNVIDDLELVIDGKKFDDFDWTGTGTYASSTFDIDGDYTVDEGDRVKVEVRARFKSANGVNYTPGETVRASVSGANIEGEGADDLVASGNATGETHTLEVSGLSGARGDRSAVTTVADGADNDYATFRVDVKVTAFDQDVFIPMNAVDAFTYQILDASTGAVLMDATATTSSVTSTADSQGDYYRVNEGDTEDFSFMATLNPLSSDESRSYRMRLVSIKYNDTEAAPDQTWNALPANMYQTNATYIND